ncbi:MAG: DEAD/DEAH box helicase family protein [Armatimonadota bacterium]
MAYVVDRVVICDAFQEPGRHYELLGGGRSRLVDGRRPSMRYLVNARSARNTHRGIRGVLGEANLFDEPAADVELNESVNELREEVRAWRQGEGAWSTPYQGTAEVTRRLLEWWFERAEERSAEWKRFFFCQQEAIETLIYLYEVKGRPKMPETGDLLRYALKLATGTGKTVVMALTIVWSTLHKRKVSGSTLTTNFLVLVPNLTVRDRVSGEPRGDGLKPEGAENLYAAFDMVPPEYEEEFRPNVMVRNWQGISLEASREDWISENVQDEGRFIPASVLWAMQRRARQDPNAAIRKAIGNIRDVMIINDEAHHVYGQKRGRAGEDADHIKWSKIIDRINRAARISLVVDLSATPWYGSGSPKPEGTLFEWMVSDFSVYDAFESGLVKVVRLPDPESAGAQYIDLWDRVRGASTKEEYLLSCRGAIDSLYSDWSHDYQDWSSTFDEMRTTPAPVMLVVADSAQKAEWLFEHLAHSYGLLRNPEDDDPATWKTIRIDSKVFNAEKGNEALIREMVNTVGKRGMPGEHVRCIVSVNMLSEGWDVKSVTHILGLRAFGSPLLTEQIIGRGLRRASYDRLYEPLDERPDGVDETVDAFGIPFVGFPVQKKKRAPTGRWDQKPIWIEPVSSKDRFALRIPNVRSWAVGITRPLAELVRVRELDEVIITETDTPPEVRVKPVVGGTSEAILTLESLRAEYPVMRTAFLLAEELYQATNPGYAQELGIGPTFDELLELTLEYVRTRVRAAPPMDPRDIGMYYWRRRALDILENAVRQTGLPGTESIPVPGDPEYLDTSRLKRFQWTGIRAEGKRCHTNKVPCHTELERQFSDFLDRANDVVRYFKNERLGFSITYYENGRPRQYFPDFLVLVREPNGREVLWVAETKGEIRANTVLKRAAAHTWCERMSATSYGSFRHLFVPQRQFEKAMTGGVHSFAQLAVILGGSPKRQLPRVLPSDDSRVSGQAFRTLLPVYPLEAAVERLRDEGAVQPIGWISAEEFGRLDERMFVVRTVGNALEPHAHEGDYSVFRQDPGAKLQDRVVLATYDGEPDPDTGGPFTVRLYTADRRSPRGAGNGRKAALVPLNPAAKPIALTPDAEGKVQVRVLAEWLGIL